MNIVMLIVFIFFFITATLSKLTIKFYFSYDLCFSIYFVFSKMATKKAYIPIIRETVDTVVLFSKCI